MGNIDNTPESQHLSQEIYYLIAFTSTRKIKIGSAFQIIFRISNDILQNLHKV